MSVYYVPGYTGTVLSAGNTIVSKASKSSFLPRGQGLPFQAVWRKTIKKIDVKYAMYHTVIGAMEKNNTRKENRVCWIRGFSLVGGGGHGKNH